MGLQNLVILGIMCLAITGLSFAQEVINNAIDGDNSTTTETISEVTANEVDSLPNPAIERSGHAYVHADPSFKGFWSKKIAWRPRWVKTWQEKKVYVAVWKRMWGPLVVKEWVPVPKPPPGWVKHDASAYIVKKYPHH